MEVGFQQHKKPVVPTNKTTKFKGRNRASNSNKFIGVRQRPSGRWVAEIKDTTQKIRMWLGTFETAEEAAKAYDEAACLLRGSNTRTNFVTHVSLDSPLASRVRNLLNNKKAAKKQETKEKEEPAEVHSISNSTPSVSISTSCTDHSTLSSETVNEIDDVYRPDMSNFKEELEFSKQETRKYAEFGTSRYDLSWDFGPGFDGFSLAQQVLDYPTSMELPETNDVGFTEFDRMKVERQISASLYAINGVQEYMDTVEALWDLPPIY